MSAKPSRTLPNTLCIESYMHCGKCITEWGEGAAEGLSPRDWSHLSVGFTKEGLQVWCNRHDCNVVHIHFEGQKHPANMSIAGDNEPN